VLCPVASVSGFLVLISEVVTMRNCSNVIVVPIILLLIRSQLTPYMKVELTLNVCRYCAIVLLNVPCLDVSGVGTRNEMTSL
jgi:hypothetical protein